MNELDGEEDTDFTQRRPRHIVDDDEEDVTSNPDEQVIDDQVQSDDEEGEDLNEHWLTCVP